MPRINDPFKTAAPGFDDPLGMLRACHERILRQCETLERMPQHVRTKGIDDEMRRAAARVYHYFSTSGQQHHRDEEEGLFPLLATGDLGPLIHGLEQDHARMERLWSQLAPLLQQPEQIPANTHFTAHIQEFVTLYRAHLEIENTRLLPQATAHLSGAQLIELGAGMASRRGVKPE